MKYIDAEKLLAILERQNADKNIIQPLIRIIESLQQEQQEKKEVKFVFPKFLYARTTNNKTIDVSYAPQSLDSVEYIRSDSIQQEQPEVDLMKEINEYMSCEDNNPFDWDWRDKQACACHFFELGLNARKEE